MVSRWHDLQIADKGHGDLGNEQALIDHGHLVVLESKYTIVDIKFGQILSLYGYIVLLLHAEELFLHFMPSDVLQVLLKCPNKK